MSTRNGPKKAREAAQRERRRLLELERQMVKRTSDTARVAGHNPKEAPHA
ncbi:MAG: hypothetical protein ACHQ01_07790 [Candidatus Limnocylindrales bacterium]